ncbi:hypothetical protein TNCV_2674661 [Trichonephila clavipes]|nr:hypothetical protein TNCV_2674661 [Trichonephila clavipes]
MGPLFIVNSGSEDGQTGHNEPGGVMGCWTRNADQESFVTANKKGRGRKRVGEKRRENKRKDGKGERGRVGDGKEKKRSRGERGGALRMQKGLSPRLLMNAGAVENRID